MKRAKLGERELDLMNALWERGEATTGEVLEHLHGRGLQVAYNTVQTMLNRLESKGHVSRQRQGRVFVYRPRSRRPILAGRAVRSLVQRFFGGSAEALARHLVEDDLTSEERKRVQDFIASLRRKREA